MFFPQQASLMCPGFKLGIHFSICKDFEKQRTMLPHGYNFFVVMVTQYKRVQIFFFFFPTKQRSFFLYQGTGNGVEDVPQSQP